MEWQPIETAPHGTDVLLGWRERDKWVCQVGPYSTGERLSNGYSNRVWHGWATHWMPLPPPPGEAP